MSPPQHLKEMHKLAGYMPSLGRFILKLGERALPFFKIMKMRARSSALEAEASFQNLNRYLTSPLVMVAPRPLEPLVLYLAATPHSASVTLMAVQEERAGTGARRSTPSTATPLSPQDGAHEASTTPSDGEAPEAPCLR